jgi:sugar O-acyltransferase (sialic acid O-acetyltransferase NeuD family)
MSAFASQPNPASAQGVILFGVGSPLIVEHVESCRRCGWSIVAVVKNRNGKVYFDNDGKIFDTNVIDPALTAHPCLCPLFTPANRAVATREAERLGFRFDVALVDPHVIVTPTSLIGGGSFVNTGCIIGAEVSMSRHVLINRGASIGHHVRVGECVSIGPGAIIGGFAQIERGAMIGAGAIVLPKVKIGAFATVGAGAVVTRDVPNCMKVVGNPARATGTKLEEFDLPEN